LTILQIGAGGVGWVVAHKAAQNNDVFGDLVIASRTLGKCNNIIDSIKRKNNVKDMSRKISALTINSNSVKNLIELIHEVKPDLVINAGPPWGNISIMEACVQTCVSYIDTSAATDLYSDGQLVPNAYDPQWVFRERFKKAGITGILGAGFDPGAVSVFAAYAHKHLFDEIESIDIMDVNAGNHGQKFATNFDPETNLLEIQGDSFYWENGSWQRVPCHTRVIEYDFPLVGKHRVYSMAHDEVRSLVEFIPANKIEFWMGFSDSYLKHFGVLRDVGMLSPKNVTTCDGVTVSPLKVLKAVLPDPISLAAGYSGKTCIGTLVRGSKNGKQKVVFMYNICEHNACYKEVESQAISYTTGVPVITAALLLFQKKWSESGLFNIEQLDPDPFLELMPKVGLNWNIREDGVKITD